MTRWLGLFFLAMGLAGRADPITALAFSPDNKILLNNGFRRIEIRSAATGDPREHWACDLQKIQTLAFDASGELLAVGGGVPGEKGSVFLFDARTGKVNRQFGDLDDTVTNVAFSPDGTQLLVGSSDRTAELWKLGTTPMRLHVLKGHSGPVLSVAFNPSGRTVITASGDRSLKLWDAETGALLRTLGQHTEAVNAVAFRPGETARVEGKVFCASAADDRTVRIWQPEIGRMVRIVRQPAPVLALAYSPDGSSLFSASEDGQVRKLDPESDAILQSWPVTKEWIYAIAVRPDGKKLAMGDWAGQVRMIQLGQP